jgi:hypothetical protein
MKKMQGKKRTTQVLLKLHQIKKKKTLITLNNISMMTLIFRLHVSLDEAIQIGSETQVPQST